MNPSKRSSEEMFPLMETYVKSGKTQKSFCAEHGLSLPVFSYWLARYRRSRKAGERFVEIGPGPRAEGDALFEIAYPGGVRLRFFFLIEPAYLERLVRPLDRAGEAA